MTKLSLVDENFKAEDSDLEYVGETLIEQIKAQAPLRDMPVQDVDTFVISVRHKKKGWMTLAPHREMLVNDIEEIKLQELMRKMRKA